MKYNPFAVSALLAMVIAFGLSLRIFSQDRGFLHVVNESLATTEGYDQKFIDLANHLEKVMATRASFSYPGGKDPMTGRRREVASMVGADASQARSSANKIAANKTGKGGRTDGKVVAKNSSNKTDANAVVDTAAAAAAALAAQPPEDNVKLTALIADDYGQHTAIVMNGERSQSVEVGDMVGKRKVTKITSKEIIMEDESAVYSYELSGNRNYQKK